MKLENHRFWIGAGYGLVATAVMSLGMIAFTWMGPKLMPEPLPLSLLTRIFGRMAHVQQTTPAVLTLAILVHFIYGAWWGGLAAASIFRVNWITGLVLGLGLWLIMIIYLLPFAGDVVFRVVTSPAMWISTFAVHAIYGVTWGALTGRHELHHVEEAQMPTGPPEDETPEPTTHPEY